MTRGTILRLNRQLAIASLICLVLASCSSTDVKTKAEKEPAPDLWSDARPLEPSTMDTGKQPAAKSKEVAPLEKTVRPVPEPFLETARTRPKTKPKLESKSKAEAKTINRAKPVLPPSTVTNAVKEKPSKPVVIAKLIPSLKANAVKEKPSKPVEIAKQELLLQFRLEQLPMQISDNWTLVLETDLTTSKAACRLVSREFVMEDGQGIAKVTLMAYADQLRINTNSNIDLSYDGDGIQFDAKPELFPIEALDRETNLVFRSSASAIYREMREAEFMTLLLGFWPTWPVTRVYPLQLDLEDFDFAWSAMEQCRKKL